MHDSDSLIIIPTYNEKENIEKIIRAVFGLEKCFHILVIDDGSPDGTAAIVKRLISEEFADRLHGLCSRRPQSSADSAQDDAGEQQEGRPVVFQESAHSAHSLKG